jgi:excisionase family DNA binding protein
MATKPIERPTLPPGPNRHSRRHPETSPGRRWASMQQAADYMGVTVRTCREWISQGKIRGYRINARVIRVDLNELDGAMEPFGGAV